MINEKLKVVVGGSFEKYKTEIDQAVTEFEDLVKDIPVKKVLEAYEDILFFLNNPKLYLPKNIAL
jgi:hypothetical protein